MGLFSKLQLNPERVIISWDITPANSYGLFECRGDMKQVRSKKERYYYFYIDNWQKPARLCFMERGIRHARVLAHIDTPHEMIEHCVVSQGKTFKEHSYAIDQVLRHWLEENIINVDEDAKIIVTNKSDENNKYFDTQLPEQKDPLPKGEQINLRCCPRIVREDEIAGLVGKQNFFERKYNPEGRFDNSFIGNSEVVTDRITNLTWQRKGCDHTYGRKLLNWIEDINRENYAGFNDWRLPTIDEALSLTERVKNGKGLYLAGCFNVSQTYIFTADRRKPGGWWFVDFGQAKVYWAAGSCFSGGYGRLCRGGNIG